jgi:hypothetical protein
MCGAVQYPRGTSGERREGTRRNPRSGGFGRGYDGDVPRQPHLV